MGTSIKFNSFWLRDNLLFDKTARECFKEDIIESINNENLNKIVPIGQKVHGLVIESSLEKLFNIIKHGFNCSYQYTAMVDDIMYIENISGKIMLDGSMHIASGSYREIEGNKKEIKIIMAKENEIFENNVDICIYSSDSPGMHFPSRYIL